MLNRRITLVVCTALALVVSVASLAHAEAPDEVMDRFRAAARTGDVKAFKTFIHPSKGLKLESGKVTRKKVTQDWMLSAEFLKTARRSNKATCSGWKRGKCRCDINLGKSGGHSYFFVTSKKGVFLMKTRIYDGS